VEAFKIGFACEAGDDYHLHADLCHVKIVDPSGATVADGQKGEVVISNLVNRATVLLNYRLGDIAAKVTRSCTCGRTLPLLANIEGRLEDVLVLRDGSFVHPLSIWGIFKSRPEVLRYQVIQHTADTFDLRLVTADRNTYDRLLPRSSRRSTRCSVRRCSSNRAITKIWKCLDPESSGPSFPPCGPERHERRDVLQCREPDGNPWIRPHSRLRQASGLEAGRASWRLCRREPDGDHLNLRLLLHAA
jgi:hypothetical protein